MTGTDGVDSFVNDTGGERLLSTTPLGRTLYVAGTRSTPKKAGKKKGYTPSLSKKGWSPAPPRPKKTWTQPRKGWPKLGKKGKSALEILHAQGFTPQDVRNMYQVQKGIDTLNAMAKANPDPNFWKALGAVGAKKLSWIAASDKANGISKAFFTPQPSDGEENSLMTYRQNAEDGCTIWWICEATEAVGETTDELTDYVKGSVESLECGVRSLDDGARRRCGNDATAATEEGWEQASDFTETCLKGYIGEVAGAGLWEILKKNGVKIAGKSMVKAAGVAGFIVGCTLNLAGY